MKIAILGCGYIGRALLKYWRPVHQYLIATTTHLTGKQGLIPLANEVHILEGSDEASVQKILSDVAGLVVCVAPRKGANYQQTYLETAQTLARVFSEECSVKHLVYTSSVSVYGDCNGDWVTEDTPVNPMNERAEILCRTESIYLQALPSSVCVTVLRLAGIYGPHRDLSMHTQRLPSLARDKAYVNRVHQEDAVRAIDWAYTNQLSGIYNVCSSDHPQSVHQTTHPSKEFRRIGNKRVSNGKIKASGFDFLHTCEGPIDWIEQGNV